MLTYAEPVLISIFPALPKESNKGKIEDVLLRGPVTLKRLAWNEKQVTVELLSAITQKVILQLPKTLTKINVEKDKKGVS